jgi:hypothetical protein
MPERWEEKAKELGAFTRGREIKSSVHPFQRCGEWLGERKVYLVDAGDEQRYTGAIKRITGCITR